MRNSFNANTYRNVCSAKSQYGYALYLRGLDGYRAHFMCKDFNFFLFLKFANVIRRTLYKVYENMARNRIKLAHTHTHIAFELPIVWRKTIIGIVCLISRLSREYSNLYQIISEFPSISLLGPLKQWHSAIIES